MAEKTYWDQAAKGWHLVWQQEMERQAKFLNVDKRWPFYEFIYSKTPTSQQHQEKAC